MAFNLMFPPQLATQLNFDSGSLALLGVIGHRLDSAGTYMGRLLRNGKTLASFALEVSDMGDQPSATVDLAELHGLGRSSGRSDNTVKSLQVRTGGYLVLSVSQDDGGYNLTLQPMQTLSAVVWNSQQLVSGDIFTAIILRPGSYSLRNTLNLQMPAAKVVVSYPDPRLNKRDASRPGPASMVSSAQGFSVNKLVLVPGQGLVFNVQTPSRIQLTLDKPDDGPADLAQWRETQRSELIRRIRESMQRG